MYEKAIDIARSNSDNLKSLASISGYDPKYYYFDADFNGVDIRGQDLVGLELGAARFAGVRANALTKLDPQFRGVVLQAALDTIASGELPAFLHQIRDRDPEYIALLAAAGRSEEAYKLAEEIISSNRNLPLFNSDIIECDLFSSSIENRYFNKWFENNKVDSKACFNIAIFLLLDKDLDSLRSAAIEFVRIHVKSGYISNVIFALFQRRLVLTTGAGSLVALWIRKHARNNRLPDIWTSYLVAGERHIELDRLLLRWLRGVARKTEFDGVFWLAAKMLSPKVYSSLVSLKKMDRPDFGSEINHSIISGLKDKSNASLSLWHLVKSIRSGISEVNKDELFIVYKDRRETLLYWANIGKVEVNILTEVDELFGLGAKESS